MRAHSTIPVETARTATPQISTERSAGEGRHDAGSGSRAPVGAGEDATVNAGAARHPGGSRSSHKRRAAGDSVQPATAQTVQAGKPSPNGAKASGANSLSHVVNTQGNIEAFGQALFHGFTFPFEVTSLLIIVAILGAMVLGRRA